MIPLEEDEEIRGLFPSSVNLIEHSITVYQSYDRNATNIYNKIKIGNLIGLTN